jgi:hypothetical protein
MGGMDRQTLRNWVQRFNAAGLDGLLDNWTSGPVQVRLPNLHRHKAEFPRYALLSLFEPILELGERLLELLKIFVTDLQDPILPTTKLYREPKQV